MTAFISSVGQLITLRLFLGAFEAGFLPGIVLYLTFWFPISVRARVTAVIFIANSVGGALAAPFSGWIMTSLDGAMGLPGWRWVFLIEGAPACVHGIISFFYLKDGPASARWLTTAEKLRLSEQLAASTSSVHALSHRIGREVFANPLNYVVAYLFFSAICCNYLLFFWLPTIVREAGVQSLMNIGLLSALPLICGCVGAIAISWSSDVLGDRRWHLIFCFLLMAASLFASTRASSLPMILTAFSLASFTTGAVGPLIFAIPPSYLSLRAAPAGIAFVSTLGGIAGFASPPALGYIKTVTGSLTTGVEIIAVLCAIGAIAVAIAVPSRATRMTVASDPI
ncbi:MFS transporter [Paraburkholderia sediminicola]|nr:MFS transporter [Paraburkholderia sediminicola]